MAINNQDGIITFSPVFTDYELEKGKFLLFGNGTFIDPERYNLLNNNTIQFIDEDDIQHSKYMEFTMAILRDNNQLEEYNGLNITPTYVYTVKQITVEEDNQKEFSVPQIGIDDPSFLVFVGSICCDIKGLYTYNRSEQTISFNYNEFNLTKGRKVTFVFLNKNTVPSSGITEFLNMVKLEFPIIVENIVNIPSYLANNIRFHKEDLLVFINGTYIKPDRYEIEDGTNIIHFLDTTDQLKVGKMITAIYLKKSKKIDESNNIEGPYSYTNLKEDNNWVIFDEMYARPYTPGEENESIIDLLIGNVEISGGGVSKDVFIASLRTVKEWYNITIKNDYPDMQELIVKNTTTGKSYSSKTTTTFQAKWNDKLTCNGIGAPLVKDGSIGSGTTYFSMDIHLPSYTVEDDFTFTTSKPLVYLTAFSQGIANRNELTELPQYALDWLKGKKIGKINILFGSSGIGDEYGNISMEKLKYIPFLPCDTSECIQYTHISYGCKNLISINTDWINTESAISLDQMWCYTPYVDSLDVSHFKTDKCKIFQGVFRDCRSVRSLDLSKWNTNNSTTFRLMFDQCEFLTKLDLTSFTSPNCVDFAAMFIDCTNLKTITMPNIDTSKGKLFCGMFGRCPNLETIDGVIDMKSATPGKWSYGVGWLDGDQISVKMFQGCSKLRGVKIKNPPSDFTENSGLNSNQYTIVS